MMVRFTSKAGPDIVMFEEDAKRLLRMMQHSGTIPSAIGADQLQTSLGHLERALHEQEGQITDVQPADAKSTQDPVDDDGEDERVSIQNRAFPLVQLLKAAMTRQANIMWDYDDGAFY